MGACLCRTDSQFNLLSVPSSSCSYDIAGAEQTRERQIRELVKEYQDVVQANGEMIFYCQVKDVIVY